LSLLWRKGLEEVDIGLRHFHKRRVPFHKFWSKLHGLYGYKLYRL